MQKDVAIITVADDRLEVYRLRETYVINQMKSLEWIKNNYNVLETGIVCSDDKIENAIACVKVSGATCVLIHIPIWSPPSFTLNICRQLELPVMIIGNILSETSSMVGILGAGGALDEIGIEHERIFDMNSNVGNMKINAFIRACKAKNMLLGQRFGKFGSYSLGIFTTEADPAQWQKVFGIETILIDQYEIVKEAENIDMDVVSKNMEWFQESLGNWSSLTNEATLIVEKQLRSYLATKKIIEKKKLNFVAVKCQTELSDGYVTQCAAHMLLNSSSDADGTKDCIVHACESDSNGALTMQILKLLSDGSATALLDIRFYDSENDNWILANCGAIASDFYKKSPETNGLKEVNAVKHVFGIGGGLAYPAMISPRNVTLARLCRSNGTFNMAIMRGEVIENEISRNMTSQFPQAKIKLLADASFVQKYGSNHIHMVTGDYVEELIFFCKLSAISYEVFK